MARKRPTLCADASRENAVRQGPSTSISGAISFAMRCSTKIPIAACGALWILLATDLITMARPSPVRVTRRSKEVSPSTAYRS